jgi:hypothetical protein
MITVDDSPTDHVEMFVAAPLGVSDITAAGTALRQLVGRPAIRRMLVVVESIGLPKPEALWEDLKLAPLIIHIRRVALITDIKWYALLSEISGALWPRLTIKHFEPSEAAMAREWLAAGSAA